MRRRDLERAARRIVEILGKDECVLVGGLAVGAYGYVRATQDVDFVSRIPLVQVQKRLREHDVAATLRRGDPLDGDFSCVSATIEGVRVDILPPLVPIEWERALELPLTRTVSLRVVDLDALLQLKLRAGGAKDLMDVAALVLCHPEQRERAQELATGRGLSGKLASWLEDARLVAEIAETRAGARAARRLTPGRPRAPKPRSAPRRGR